MADPRKFTLHPVSLLIALTGPLIWVIDSWVGSRQNNASFTRQLFFPAPAEFWFRTWFVLSSSLLAFFAGRSWRSRDSASLLGQTLDTRLEPVVQESTVVEEEPHQAIPAGTAGQISRQEEMQRQELEKKLQQATRSLEQKYAQQLQENIFRERQQIGESIRKEEEKKAEEQIRVLKSNFAQEITVKLALERSQLEDSVRQEAQKKLAEQLRQIEGKRATAVSADMAQERIRIEEAIRKEERTKAAEAEAALKRQYDELMRAQLETERLRIEEQFMHDAESKAEAKILAIEARHEQDIKERVVRERKTIAESVRQEEQKLAEALRTLEQKQAQRIDEVRQEEKSRQEESVRVLEQKFTRDLQLRIAEERQAIEEAARREAEKRIEDEKKISAENARQEEQRKAADAIKVLEKKHAETLAQAAKKFEEQELAKAKGLKNPDMGKLVKGLAQQVMNPLAAVINNVKLMNIKLANQKEFQVSDIREAVNAIEENASLTRSILTSLSEISGGSSGTFAALSLNDLVAKIDTLYGKELKLQSITIQKVLQANLPRVSADPTLLFLAMFNLVANAKWAIKNNTYGTGGTITIKTRKSSQEGFVELIISDDGVGIAKQDLNHVFEPFFTTKKEGEGLGLGLTVVSEIVKAHKGRIQVDSSPGGGAVFTVFLPALPEEPPA